jgi:hypothetical protein
MAIKLGTRQRSLLMIAKFTLSLLSATCAYADSVAAQDDVTFALSNRIGLVIYCAENGFLESEVANESIDRMRTAVKVIGASAPNPAAEAAGKLGLWGRSALPIADRAQLFDQSVEAFCEELVAGL